MATKQQTATAIRFPADVREELKKAAEERDISVNSLVVRAVKELLPRLTPAEQFRNALIKPIS